jgi:hypothetical protein
MLRDWNKRASDDAYYYAAFGRRRQEDGEFSQTAVQELDRLEQAIGRLATPPRSARALEIGCGPLVVFGRVLRVCL